MHNLAQGLIVSLGYLCYKVSYFQRSPVTRHRRGQAGTCDEPLRTSAGEVSAQPMVCKLLYTLPS